MFQTLFVHSPTRIGAWNLSRKWVVDVLKTYLKLLLML